MIEYIKGEISELEPAVVVIETNGIGYLLNISLTTYSRLKKGEVTKLYAYEVIREDAHTLYGFKDKAEREMFLHLISVSGVGPNTARVIQSTFNVPEIEGIIASNNTTLLKGVKGIGLKTAERIIVDLKDKIKQGDSTLIVETAANNAAQQESVAALVMLGYQQAAARKVIQKITKENPSARVEELIKGALKLL